jgi:hypothetical protein
MMKRTTKIAALIVGAITLIPVVYFGALFTMHGFSRDFLAIDSCLDGGGRWNYTQRTCEH